MGKTYQRRIARCCISSVICLFSFGGSAQAQQGLAPVSCLIEPDQVIRLSTPVAGIVADVLVERGDHVDAGQIIAKLDTSIEEIALQSARARFEDTSEIAALEVRIEFLESQARRNEQLARNNSVSEITAREARLEADLALKELEQAKLNKRIVALELADAQARLEQKILRSPIGGVVTERLLNPGEYRDGQAHMATIAKVDELRVESFVPISYYDHILVGQKAVVLPEAPLDQPVSATIEIIDQVFDAATATVGVRLALPNADLTLPAGLRCVVQFSSDIASK